MDSRGPGRSIKGRKWAQRMPFAVRCVGAHGLADPMRKGRAPKTDALRRLPLGRAFMLGLLVPCRGGASRSDTRGGPHALPWEEQERRHADAGGGARQQKLRQHAPPAHADHKRDRCQLKRCSKKDVDK